MATNIFTTLPNALQSVRTGDIVALLLVLSLLRLIAHSRRGPHVRPTQLPGPPSPNFFVGLFPAISGLADPVLAMEKWSREYGSVFSLPMGLGRKDVIITDVKAVAHVLARDTYGYQQSKFSRVFLDNMIGKGILSVETDVHRRHRKALSPAFSNVAIRGYVNVFNDTADKLKASWDAILDSRTDIIEVQSWMNKLAIENLGVAGFGHHFNSFSSTSSGKPEILQIFESFEPPQVSSLLSKIFFFLGPMFPSLLKLPTQNTVKLRNIRYSMKGIADELLERTRRELKADGEGTGGEKGATGDKSIIGLLVKAESAAGGLTMSSDEVLAQMNTLFFAGYETTSTTLTWALVELCRHPQVQEKLREELNQLGGEITWEQITHGLPYLDAVTQEVLRMHAPVDNLLRQVHQDDVIPLSKPIPTTTGTLVSELVVARGQSVHLPIGFINMSEDIWGPDVKEFKPERWLNPEGLSSGAQAIQGHHHVMSFSDGPRFCLGRQFALANFKTTLSNLVRWYRFEMPNGKENTVIERHLRILPRPKVAGEEGASVPLRVKRLY